MSEAPLPEAIRPTVPCAGKRKKRFARVLTGLCVLLLALFHQPLLRAGLKRVAVHFAARENVALSLKLEGSVWTDLTLKDLRAVATGPSPVESISIERLRVEYNLWTLLREGREEFLSFYHLRNAHLALDPGKGNENQKRNLLHVLRDILQQPSMNSDRAQIENLNLTLRTPEGIYRLSEVHALLDPLEHGYVRMGALVLPGIGAWQDLHTSATYVNRHLVMRHFNLGEEVRVDRLELDSSHRAQGVRYLSFEGAVLGGDLGLFLWERESPSGAVKAQVTAYLHDLPLESLAKYRGKSPITGRLKEAWMQLSGDPLVPSEWVGQLTAAMENGGYGGFPVDTVSAKVSVGEGILRLEELLFSLGKNRLAFRGEQRLPKTWERSAFANFQTAFTLNAPELSRLHGHFTGGAVHGKGTVAIQNKSLAVEGDLTASGVQGAAFGVARGSAVFQGQWNGSGTAWGGGLSGHARVEASDLHFREFAARHLTLDLPVAGATARVATFALDINGEDQFGGKASVGLSAPFAYEANLSGNVQDLSVFQPFVSIPLGGALEIQWHGTGEIARMRHTGEGRVALEHGRVGEWTGVEGELAGVYSPESIDITALRARCDQGTLQAGVRLRDQRLQVDGFRLTAGKTGVATGGFSLPLDLRTPTRRETIFPASGALAGTLVLDQIDLAQLFPAAPPGLAVRGMATGSFTAGGTLAAPEITAKLEAHNLQTGVAEKCPPASGNAALVFKDSRLLLSGTLAQPGLSTLSFRGGVPLDLRKILTERRIDPATTPIEFSVKLPPSSAELLAPLIPGVRLLDGRLSMDASATGTWAKPVFSGGIALDLAAIRFQSADFPGINHLRGDLRFAGTELTFQRCTGDVAGGPFSVTGRLGLDRLADPFCDLRLQSQGTLLARNDTLTLRTDADLHLTGPFSKAALSGKIGVTKSRFFREIDILPIGLPGRPVPKPAKGWFTLSTDTLPFRNWAYHVEIQTVEPFLVKGNLANGAIVGDLQLGGTGLAPTLEGTAYIQNFVASLPFSRLMVDHGALYFSGNASLNPTLDIHGFSRIRDYNVNVYLYGTAAEPQTLFTSEPSLPQEEVIALLATGATTREFAQNNQALAGRAAVLVFQDVYRKLFPRRPPPENKANPMDRFSLDVGGVDPRTGRQELMGKFKLSDQYQIGAGVDMQGDVRMQLQYLIRFR
ncbi:MAG: translocation/assembly module TamB domain-containing protein [Verrucomicrobia bacterium]|nr:translocation/assembly module TamB domain-containing protein [Verrucomicrobiota bacterium]